MYLSQFSMYKFKSGKMVIRLKAKHQNAKWKLIVIVKYALLHFFPTQETLNKKKIDGS
jgi:hypothetical protein